MSMTSTIDQTTKRQSKYRGLVPVLNTMNALVVGCGSLGSHLIAMLSRMQPATIYCVDMDDVVAENLGVQDYQEEDKGRPKVEVMAYKYGGDITTIHPYNMRFEQFAKSILKWRRDFFTHVFMCVDNMDTRRAIWEEFEPPKWNGVIVDGRLDANTGWVYACKNLRDWYGKTLYPESEVINTVNRCAIQMTGYSAHVVAGLMVAQAMRFSQDQSLPGEKCGIDLNNMIFFPVTT